MCRNGLERKKRTAAAAWALCIDLRSRNQLSEVATFSEQGPAVGSDQAIQQRPDLGFTCHSLPHVRALRALPRPSISWRSAPLERKLLPILKSLQAPASMASRQASIQGGACCSSGATGASRQLEASPASAILEETLQDVFKRSKVEQCIEGDCKNCSSSNCRCQSCLSKRVVGMTQTQAMVSSPPQAKGERSFFLFQ